jgi:hypothetical protein
LGQWLKQELTSLSRKKTPKKAAAQEAFQQLVVEGSNFCIILFCKYSSDTDFFIKINQI